MRANNITGLSENINIKENGITFDYIRGLIEGEGCFTFCNAKSGTKIWKIPTFAIGMANRDKNLLSMIVNKLDLHNIIHVYKPRIRKDGYKRQGTAILMVRDLGQLKNIIVPLLYKRLIGNKGIQFKNWIEKIDLDPDVPIGFNIISKLYKSGFYDRNRKFQ